MFRSICLIVASLACACFIGATPAAAQITFTLNSVSLGVLVGGSTVSAGSLTGTFTTSSNTITNASTLLTWNIVAPSTAAINGNAFAGFTYNPSDSTAYFNVGGNGLLTGFELDSPLNSTSATQVDSIRFYFKTNLSTSGPITLGTPSSLPSSYESEHNSGGNRNVVAGTVSATPEPSSWMMGVLALGLFAGLCLRSRTARA